MGQVRVLIADDRPLFAKTLEALLSGTPGLEIVGTAGDGLKRSAWPPRSATRS